MKTKTKLLTIVFLTSISASYLLNSCSLIGLGIGASVDKKTSETSKIYKNQIDQLEIGNKVKITLLDGDIKNGKFGGVVQIYDQNFHLEYDSIKNSLNNQVIIPNINDTILIYLVSDKNEGNLGIFKGFESGKLWYRYFYSHEFSEIELSLIDNIMVNYRYGIDSLQISHFILKQKFPGFIMMKMQIGGIEEIIPYNKISSIQVLNKRNAKFVGLGIGLAIDTIIAVAAVRSMQSMSFEMSF